MSLATQYPRGYVFWAAARPSQVALVGLVYALGVGMGAARDPPDPGRVALGAAVLLPAVLAVHYGNEYSDADTDRLGDRTAFSGGSGALGRTGLGPAVLRRGTVVAGCAAVVAVGAGLSGGVPVAALLLDGAILVLGLAYSLPPVRLVARGLGEVTNALLGGVLLPLYGVAVVTTPRPADLLSVVPFALLVGCNLFATHWADRDADRRTGKRTLAVRWSPAGVRRAYLGLVAAAAGSTAVLTVESVLPVPVALAHLVAAPFLLWGWQTLARRRSPLPAVAAMVSVAVSTTVARWALAL